MTKASPSSFIQAWDWHSQLKSSDEFYKTRRPFAYVTGINPHQNSTQILSGVRFRRSPLPPNPPSVSADGQKLAGIIIADDEQIRVRPGRRSRRRTGGGQRRVERVVETTRPLRSRVRYSLRLERPGGRIVVGS